ncbi:MAG: T9SS type A sorting domain-containing protein [Bacteroidetes bacterium]|nr:T9SS type A sorting domain-containing protein [Bacteroidota bacterium]MCW5932323.1 T9SS type A sorting domain-containing protein [Bacteroidota bacterium]
MFKKSYTMKLFFLLLFHASLAFAQHENNIWCFGDSAGINFNTSPPSTFISAVKGRGSCVSVADTAGNLLFYGQTFYYPLWMQGGHPDLTAVFNKNHQLMDNGDNIIGEGWYQELTSFRDPGNDNRYYLFSLNVTGAGAHEGLYYSIIDMTLNNGLGKVVSKNNMLLNDFMADGLAAVKHGNGRDWWIVCRKCFALSTGLPVTDYYLFLISPSGVSGPFIQVAGQPTVYNIAKLVFSPSGNKMIYFNARGLFEYYSFDRCTGDISLLQTVFPEITSYKTFFGGAFSPDETKFYLQTIAYPDTNYLVQFNLAASNIALSADTLSMQIYPTQIGGDARLAPDGKIYVSKPYYDGLNFIFPYPDTTYNIYNSYIGVVNYPDSLGAACDYQPYSFFLGGARTYSGLPNNPVFGLGPLVNSMCDTITGMENPTQATLPLLNVFFESSWGLLYVNAHNLKFNSCTLNIFDSYGRLIYTEKTSIQPPFYSTQINCSTWSSGVYSVQLISENTKLTARFAKP